MSVNAPTTRTQKAVDRFLAHRPLLRYSTGEHAAVLVCLFIGKDDNELHVVLTVRAKSLRTHAGEVALPGGKADESDPNIIATAFREAHEEIGLPPDAHTRLCILRPFISKNLIIVTPVVSLLNPGSDFTPSANPSEVSAVFSLPLPRFLSSHNYTHHDMHWLDGLSRMHRFNSPHIAGKEDAGWPVTGLTAHILLHAATVGYGFYQGPEGSTPEKGETVDGVVLEVEESAQGREEVPENGVFEGRNASTLHPNAPLLSRLSSRILVGRPAKI